MTTDFANTYYGEANATAQPDNTSGDQYNTYDYPAYSGNGTYYEGYNYEDYLYFGFPFERPIYMFFWPMLVALATVANVLLIVILSKKTLRNSTNVVLIGIALAEMLTLLVTIPTYVLAYHNFDQGPGTDVYVLTQDWCNVFMICKFFLSKWFRTASIWLHCFLGFHRLMAIWKPFSFLQILRIRWSCVIIVLLYIVSPVPHNYRLRHKHAINGLCGWGVQDWCDGGCSHNWIVLILVDLVPCFFLTLFTVLIVVKLCQSTDLLGSTEMLSKPHLTLRRTENRRSSLLVTTVVLSLLIPEIPYVVFLIYMETTKAATASLVDRTDREFHTAYEVLIAMSFTTNFFINFILNTTFRRELIVLFGRCCGPLCKRTSEFKMCMESGEYNMDGTSDLPGDELPQTQESIV